MFCSISDLSTVLEGLLTFLWLHHSIYHISQVYVYTHYLLYSLLPPPPGVPQPGVGGGTLVTRLQPLPGAEVGARQPAVVRLLKIKLKQYIIVCKCKA